MESLGQRRKGTPASWQPSEEMAQAILYTMENQHAHLWQNIKSLQTKQAVLTSEMIKELKKILETIIPDIDAVKLANTLLWIRQKADTESQREVNKSEN